MESKIRIYREEHVFLSCLCLMQKFGDTVYGGE